MTYTTGRSVLCLSWLALVSSVSASEEKISYQRDIRPVLSDKCFACHGPDAVHREADLRLDDESSAKADAIVAGNAEESELWKRVTATDSDMKMPPHDSGKSLTESELKLIRRWITEGARYEPFWAWEVPQERLVPDVVVSGAQNWVDHYVLDRLGREGLSPGKPADRRTLIRRLSFDLTGLPPSPEVVEEFLRSDDPAAYERVVDRLLSSQAYGERMAMYWLDLVRYADTVGYHGDQDHNISPYRDYVIRAFEKNKPFDVFTREQLGGDLLEESGIEQKVATGYNRLLQTTHEGGLQPKEYRAIYAADRVRNVSAVWMAATLGCCQCHDHKFDPYSTRDFYSMAAFFADIDDERHFRNGTNSLPSRRDPEIEVPTDGQARELKSVREKIQRLQAAPDQSKKKSELKRLTSVEKKIRQSIRKTMVTVALEKPRTTRVLPRGNWLDETGPVVHPAVPMRPDPLPHKTRLNRLDLANWLVDPRGAGLLTARVMVNRFWYLCFGNGLAGTLDDFGNQGQPPEHPELLDQLAVEFVRSDWNVRQMMKLIVMSRTYRQTSFRPAGLRDRDPQNRLYAVQSSYRLPAEMIRDQALFVSGLLVHGDPGGSVRPYQPDGYYQHLNFPRRRYSHHTDQRQWRRGVYVHWQRQFLHPTLKALDAPTREECTAQRARSNTPLAALALLNDPTFNEAARVLAARIVDEADNDAFPKRVGWLFRSVLSRAPDRHEFELLKGLYEDSRRQFSGRPADARRILEVGQAPVSDGDPVVLASWTMVARAVLNLSETVTRN